MFLGNFTPKLDEKGRLFLPAKFRDQLSEGVVVTAGQERCLNVWAMADFQQHYSPANARVNDKEMRAFTRMLASAASEETPDKQGRITIIPALREYAGLTKEVVVIGAWNHAEIWHPDTWALYQSEQIPKFADMDVDPFGTF